MVATESTLQKYKDKKEVYGQFIVYNNLDIDHISLNLINELHISYDAIAKQVFSISNEPNILQVTKDQTISAFSSSVIDVHFTGLLTPFTTPLASIASPRNQHLTGGPTVFSFDSQRHVCKVAITNTAPYAISLRQNKFFGTLDQWTEVDTPIPTTLWTSSSTS